MREVEISIPGSQSKHMQFLLQENLGKIFKSSTDKKVYLSEDITTVEFDVIKECEKLCNLKGYPAPIR